MVSSYTSPRACRRPLLIFSNVIYDLPLSSIGELFAVGAFNTIRLCDRRGVCVSHHLVSPTREREGGGIERQAFTAHSMSLMALTSLSLSGPTV